MEATDSTQTRWRALTLLCLAWFLVIMDVAIVGVGAPSIKQDLGFSQQALQWVATAYAIAFGGLLLFAGRVADVVGRRRMFVGGSALFALASLAAGLAGSPAALIVARGVMGAAAAVITPAALSILTVTFEEGEARNRALGAWNATAAFGAVVGLIVGGVLTDTAGWRWMFLINVPIVLAILALAPRLLRESRSEERGTSFDAAGALTIVASIGLLVYAIVEAPDTGWGSARTIGLLAGSLALLVAFAVVEARTPAPLVPLALLRSRSLIAGNVLGVLAAGGIFGWFYLTALYLQQVLGFSPLEAGLAFLPQALGAIAGGAASQAMATRFGVRTIVVVGAAFAVAGILLSHRIAVDSGYWGDLFVPLTLIGIGIPFGFTASLISGLAGVEPSRSGVASGLVNTSQQIGNALGVAILSTIAVTQAGEALAAGSGSPAALAAAIVDGTRDAYVAGLLFPALAVVAAFVLLSGSPGRERQIAAVRASAEPAEEAGAS